MEMSNSMKEKIKFEIRKASDSDMNKIAEIAVAAWEPIYSNYRQQIGEELFAVFFTNWQERKVQEICGVIGKDSWDLYVTEMSGEIAGFISFQCKDEIGIIGNNAIHPEFQGNGIGSMQYKYALRKMQEDGIKFVKVTTGGDEGHRAARRAYEKIGFNISIPNLTYFMKIEKQNEDILPQVNI